ncbi:MAG: hypothetical protein Q4G26_12640 [Paracoccus sp. (in: a-proteobacteria)]|nr:hypothetical protein [Paracoccus sp. (in: a-proteobacteria)]
MTSFHRILLIGAAAALLWAAPVAAQDAAADDTGACGQPSVLNAQPVTLDAAPTETLGALVEIRRNEPRYIEITAGAPMALSIETLTGERDMMLFLFDSRGDVVTHDDDSGDGLNARIIARLSPGRYCAQVFAFADSDPARLVVPVSINAAPAEDACIRNADGKITLDPDSQDVITTGRLNGVARIAFQAAAGTDVTIAALSPVFDTMLSVQDGYGQEIASDDDGGGGTNSLLDIRSGETGDYCVTLSSLDGTEGPYVLSLSTSGNTAALGAPPVGFDPMPGPVHDAPVVVDLLPEPDTGDGAQAGQDGAPPATGAFGAAIRALREAAGAGAEETAGAAAQ